MSESEEESGWVRSTTGGDMEAKSAMGIGGESPVGRGEAEREEEEEGEEGMQIPEACDEPAEAGPGSGPGTRRGVMNCAANPAGSPRSHGERVGWR